MFKKFLFISKANLGGDLAFQLVNEGHSVIFYSPKIKREKDIYKGFFRKVHNWRKYIKWADVIVFDDEFYGLAPERLRRNGKFVIGGTRYTKKLEEQRDFGQSELAKFGITTLPRKKFDDYESAIRFIRNKPDRYVFKPTGEKQSGAKDLIIIGHKKDGSDLIEFLKKNKKIYYKKAPEFILQKFVAGVEIAVGAFFNGVDFIYPINVNFEHKRFFHGDLGPMTGETGTLMFWDSGENYIFKKTLAKFRDKLKKVGYIEYIDLNCIVNKNGIYPLEFTSRFGYPTIQIQLEGIKDKLGKWLYMLATKQKFNLKTKAGFQMGVVIFTPPALSEKNRDVEEVYRGLAISFKGGQKKNGVHIGDVYNDSGVWRLAGISGWNLIITGSGKTVKKAREIVYRRVNNIKIPYMFYREDIGQKWFRERACLKKWGYF